MYLINKDFYIKKLRLINCLVLVFYKLILYLSYINFISKQFSYQGFIFEPSIIKIILSCLICFLFAFNQPIKIKKASDFLISFCFYIFVVPLSIFFALSNSEYWIYLLVIFQYFLMLYFRNFNIVFSRKNIFFKKGFLITKIFIVS